LLLLAVPTAGSGDSEETPRAVRGTAVSAEIPHVRETFDDIRRRAPAQFAPQDGHRVIPFRRTPRPTAPSASERTGPAPQVATGSEPSPVPIRRSSTFTGFQGLVNDLTLSRDVIPPDTMGAAGPDHLVSILNSEFAVFSKAGTLLSSSRVTLQEFWSSLGTDPGEPADFPFDPKILYDQHSGRFVAVTLDCTVAPHSWVLVAVSTTSDPTGQWDKFAIDADLDNGVVQSGNSADYPGLGVDASNIYITANMFDNSDNAQYAKVWVIPKAQDLSGASPVTWFEFRDPEPFRFSVQPAHSFGSAPAEYFLFEGSGSSLRLARIDNVAGNPLWHASVAVPITPYTLNGNLTGAPQQGDPGRIDTADTRILNAVYRNGAVWGTHHVGVGSSGKTEVAWYRIDAATGKVVSQGRVSDASLWYYYPSIAVNKDNVAALGFSGSSTAKFASTFYTLVWPSTGLADTVTLLKAGEAAYTKTLGGPSIRWGDFSATTVDPSDDNTFWTLQEYAESPSGGTSRWGTWWGRIVPGEPSAPPPPSSGGGGGGGGCAIVGRSRGTHGDDLPLDLLPILLVPAAVCVRRRIIRRRSPA